MTRTLSGKQLLSIKYKTFEFDDFWLEVFGEPEITGIWLIYGLEKNGKTWFTLKLGEYLSSFKKTLYVSAEEGKSKSFQDAYKRARVDFNSKKYQFIEYEEWNDLKVRLKKKAAAKIVIVDNANAYIGEIKKADIVALSREFPDTLFIFLAHEERNEPEGSIGKFLKKWAKIFIQIKGLSAFVAGRCPGGIINIDEDKAQLYHGTKIK